VPIIVNLIDSDGKQIRRIPEPEGTIFDAAGGFDRFVEESTRSDVWRLFDPEGDVVLNRADAQEILDEVPIFLDLARNKIEQNGLKRLLLLANMCAGSESLYLRSLGD